MLANIEGIIRLGYFTECYADAAHVTQTNPVKKLRQDNALTFEGREQAVEAARKLNEMNFVPSFIWVSNTGNCFKVHPKVVAITYFTFVQRELMKRLL